MDLPETGAGRADETAASRRPPTIIDVAREAGVSKSLVSRVFRDSPHVSAANRDLVLAAATELGYRPNASAQSLVLRSSGLIGVLLPNMTNPFFAEVVDGLESAARQVRLRVTLGINHYDPQRLADSVESMLQMRVECLVISEYGFDSEAVRLAAADVPTVFIGEAGSDVGAIDVINGDDAEGARLAVRHLLDLGHRRIAHVTMRPRVPLKARSQGYVDTMREAGLEDAIYLVDTGETYRAGREAADQLLRRPSPPSAVFAVSDVVAIGIMSRLAEIGVRVPEDVAVVGYDNTELAAMWSPSLSSVQQSGSDMGQLAVQLIKAHPSGRSRPGINLLPPSLVVRRSTVALPNGLTASP